MPLSTDMVREYPDEGRDYCEIDLRAMEVRVAAAAQSGKDPYREMAAKLFQVREEQVTSEQRQSVKNALYLFLYK